MINNFCFIVLTYVNTTLFMQHLANPQTPTPPHGKDFQPGNNDFIWFDRNTIDFMNTKIFGTDAGEGEKLFGNFRTFNTVESVFNIPPPEIYLIPRCSLNGGEGGSGRQSSLGRIMKVTVNYTCIKDHSQPTIFLVDKKDTQK